MTASEIFLIGIVALACYRVTTLLTRDSIFKWLRELGKEKGLWREFIECERCVSVWAGLAAAAILCYIGYFHWAMCLPLALAFSTTTLWINDRIV